MSWMNDPPPHVLLLAGAVASAWMSWLRLSRMKSMRFKVKCIEALTCSGLSTGLTEVVILHFGWSADWAVPIGVFCGYLGADRLTAMITRFFENHTDKDDGDFYR